MDSKETANQGESVDLVLAAVKEAIRSMSNPVTRLVLSQGSEEAIGKAIDEMANVSADLAKKAFKLGLMEGVRQANSHWKAAVADLSLDKVEAGLRRAVEGNTDDDK